MLFDGMTARAPSSAMSWRGARAVSLVGDDGKRCSGAFEKVRQDLTVMDLAAGDDKAPGTTVFIDYGVNLACAAAA